MAGLSEPLDGDAELIERSWDDPERFAAIFDRYFDEIHAYLARRVGPAEADDLAGEVFLAAFVQRQRYDLRRGSARSWLYGIATNLVGTHRRREDRFYRALVRTGVPVASQDDEDRLVDRLSAVAAGPAIIRALLSLAPGDRDVLLLVALAELSYAQVAEALGIPYGTVGSRLNRARKDLREALGGISPLGVQDGAARA